MELLCSAPTRDLLLLLEEIEGKVMVVHFILHGSEPNGLVNYL